MSTDIIWRPQCSHKHIRNKSSTSQECTEWCSFTIELASDHIQQWPHLFDDHIELRLYSVSHCGINEVSLFDSKGVVWDNESVRNGLQLHVMSCAYNLIHWETKTRGSAIQDHPVIPREVKASLAYMKSCLRKRKIIAWCMGWDWAPHKISLLWPALLLWSPLTIKRLLWLERVSCTYLLA